MYAQPVSTTSDERIMAGLSHLLSWLFALIIWAAQKDRSRFVRFQAIQALFFDIAALVALLVIIGVLIVVIFGLLALGIGNIAILGSQSNPAAEPFRTIIAAMAAVPLLIPCILIPVIGLITVARFIAALQTFVGRNFHYPWLGALIERHLE